MPPFYLGMFWVGVYLTLVLDPLVVLLVGAVLAGRGFWWDFSLALGFAGTAIIGTLFLQTARFHRVSVPFGIDIIYYFHRQSSLVAFAFILVHPLLLLIVEPSFWSYFHPAVGPWEFWAGVGSLLALCLLLASSVWRKQLQINYDRWRLGHAVLACRSTLLYRASWRPVSCPNAVPV